MLTPTCEQHSEVHFKTRNAAYADETSHPLIHKQSHKKKLVSFAYISAISRTFNSLFKVLFTFPSQYLFSIGLGTIFSFRRQLPPYLRTISKVRDSKKANCWQDAITAYGILTLSDADFQQDLREASRPVWLLKTTIQRRPPIFNLSFSRFIRHY